jgi:hypothetical protein
VRLLAATCDLLAEAQGALLFAGDQSGGPTRQFRLLRRAERLDTELVSEGLEGVAAGLGTSKRSLLRAFGAIGYDAVNHLVLCRIERRPPRLDLEIYPYLPRARVQGMDHVRGAPNQLRVRSLRSLYCCSDGVRGRGAAMTYLSHRASFHSIEWIAPSNQLGRRPKNTATNCLCGFASRRPAVTPDAFLVEAFWSDEFG